MKKKKPWKKWLPEDDLLLSEALTDWKDNPSRYGSLSAVARDLVMTLGRDEHSIYHRARQVLGLKKDKIATLLKDAHCAPSMPEPKIGTLADFLEEQVGGLEQQCIQVQLTLSEVAEAIRELRCLEQWAMNTLAIREKVGVYCVDRNGVVELDQLKKPGKDS